MPTFARNHTENRKAVCILCFRKSKGSLSSTEERRISSFYGQDIDFQDPKVPSGICTTCRVHLACKEKGDEVTLPELHDFSKVFVPRFLRSAPISCNCMICKVARSGTLKSKSAAHPLGLKKRIQGRPSTGKVAAALKHCPKCLTTLARGKPHSCTPTSLTKNVAAKFPAAVEKAAISVIKTKKPSPGGTVRLSQLSGPLFPVVPGSSNSVQNQTTATLSTSALMGIQSQTSLSNNKMQQLATYLKQCSFGCQG